eukprot:m.302820 g.302820  ORF g.302820 m.302820 type:complete len:331 (+) comp40828_c0_seq6:540-1532(+)
MRWIIWVTELTSQVCSKQEAIQKAPRPSDVKSLRSFLGLVNYYGCFIPRLATLEQPLNDLLKQEKPWKWTDQCDKAFVELKTKLASADILVHYDPSLPLRLACDASVYGLGAVLSHIMPDGTERPVGYALPTLSGCERRYAQVEKEAYALKFGVTKFNQYLCGRKFTLITDHRPLTTIFGLKETLPAVAAARLHRWAVILSAYNYDIEYRTSEQHGNADGFSRLPIAEINEDELGMDVHHLHIAHLEVLPVTSSEIAKAIKRDPTLAKVLHHVEYGWPARVEDELKPYFGHRLISVESGCLMWGVRVIVPKTLQARVLQDCTQPIWEACV